MSEPSAGGDDLGEAIGSGDAAFAMVNLALILSDADRFEEARQRLEQARADFTRQGRTPLVAAVAAFLLPSVAAAGDWATWDDLLAEARAGLEASGFVDPDIARAAQRGGQLARRAGHGTRADAADERAAAQRQALRG